MPRQITPLNNNQPPGYSTVRPIQYGGTNGNNPTTAESNLGYVGNDLVDVPNGGVLLGQDGRIPANYFPNILLNQPNPIITGPLNLIYGQTATYTITNYNATYTYSVTSIAGTATISGNTITYTAPSQTGQYGFIVNGVTVAVAVAPQVITVSGPTTLNENQQAQYTINNYSASTTYTVNAIQGSVSVSGATITYTAPPGDGIHSLNAGFTVNNTTVNVTIAPPPAPTVSGPSSLATTQVGTYTITNYQTGATYNVSASFGTVSISGNTVTYTAGSSTGVYGFIVNGVNVTVNVVLPTIQTPSIQAPVSGAKNLGPSVTFTASAFTISGGSDTQKASNWQLASDPNFNTIIQQSLNDTTNLTTWTVNNLAAGSAFYARVQYIGNSGETSQYSSTTSISTKDAYVPTAITARISDGVASSDFGWSVSLNSTGTIALIGAYAENSSTGAAYIYTNQNGTWTQTARITSGNGGSFGWSVSLNSTGNIALIGAPGENAAYIYTNQNGTWTQTARITSGNGGSFGRSVSLNSTGDIALIGAYSENNYAGAAYIYTNQNGTWTQTARITSGNGGYFGQSVSLDSTGNIALIGAYNESNNAGAAYIYTNQNGTWTQTARISSGVIGSYFGNSVSLNSTGTIALIGAPVENNFNGAAYIYTNQNGTWTQTDRIAGGVSYGDFGISVSLNDNGTIALIGANNENSSAGAAYIYTNQNGTWTQTARISSGVASSGFGGSVNLNSVGTVAMIGAQSENSNTGAAYIAQ